MSKRNRKQNRPKSLQKHLKLKQLLKMLSLKRSLAHHLTMREIKLRRNKLKNQLK